jgi:hypothetical protein
MCPAIKGVVTVPYHFFSWLIFSHFFKKIWKNEVTDYRVGNKRRQVLIEYAGGVYSPRPGIISILDAPTISVRFASFPFFPFFKNLT